MADKKGAKVRRAGAKGKTVRNANLSLAEARAQGYTRHDKHGWHKTGATAEDKE